LKLYAPYAPEGTSSLNRPSEDNYHFLPLSPPSLQFSPLSLTLASLSSTVDAAAGVLPWLFWTPAILMPSNETVVFLQAYCYVHEELATVTLAIRLMPELRAFARIAGQPDRPRKGKMFVELRVRSFIVQRCDRRHNIEGSSQASVAKLIRGSQRGSKFVRTQPTRASPGEAFRLAARAQGRDGSASAS